MLLINWSSSGRDLNHLACIAIQFHGLLLTKQIWINIILFLAFQTTNCIGPWDFNNGQIGQGAVLQLAVCGIPFSP